MTKENLISALKKCAKMDPAEGHILADQALLDFINDDEVTKAFRFKKWYE
jgi:hypothetical protein